MQLNKLNNIIFIKKPESNIIEEAFIILKDNVKINDFCNNNINTFKLDQIDIQKEAENIINKEIQEQNIEYEKFKLKKLEKKNRRLKLINFLIILFAIIFIKIF